MKSTINYKTLSPTTNKPANTSTSFSRLRGFSLLIMKILDDNGYMATWEMAEKLDRGTNFVWQYLNRLRMYGAVEKAEGIWFLTDFGKYLSSVLCNNNNNNNKINTRTTTTTQQHNTSPAKKPRQVPIAAWLRDSQLSDSERTVVEVLVEHYNQTGSKFLYFPTIYDIAERFRVNPSLVNQTLMNLKQDHRVYSLKDPKHDAYKIGLYKDFVEMLKAEKT